MMADEPNITETNVDPGTNAADASSTRAQEEAAAARAPLSAPLSPAPPPPRRDVSGGIANILGGVKLQDHQAESVHAPAGQAPAFGALPTLTPPATSPGTQHEVLGMVVPPPPPPGAKKDDKPMPISSLHTMKNDLQTTVRDRKMSIVRATAMEQDRRPFREAPTIIEAPGRGRGLRMLGILFTASVLLIGLGSIAVFAVYSVTQGTPASQTATQAPSIIFAENQVIIPISNQSPSAVRQSLSSFLSQAGSVGTITQIVPIVTAANTTTGQRPATLSEFFTALNAQVPPDLLRALSDKFFLGIHMADIPSTVLIIPVVSHDRAFAGMLAWEPMMDASMAPLVKQIPSLTASPDGGLPVQRRFKDLIVRNYDVRGLPDDSGTIVLYYSFPSPDILVIASSPYTFPEVLSRLQAERKL